MALSQEPDATVLITTRDRQARVQTAVRSSLEQTARVEVIVMDDGSSDGTPEKIRLEFPEVRVIRSESPIGASMQRNLGFAAARAPIVVCLDDDAYFSSPNTVAQTISAFDDPRIGVVTIPYVNVRREQHLRQRAPDEERWVAGTFGAGASAVSAQAFHRAGGYADLAEQGEESDLAVRLLEHGSVVLLGRADHVVHDEELLVKPARTHFLSSRNHLLGTWRNVPWPYLPGRIAAVTAKVMLIGIRKQQWRATLLGVGVAARACATGRFPREPVRRSTYVLARQLLRRGPLPLAQVEPRLPPPGDRSTR